MNLIYDQTIKKINSHPNPEQICSNIERQAIDSWRDKFIGRIFFTINESLLQLYLEL